MQSLPSYSGSGGAGSGGFNNQRIPRDLTNEVQEDIALAILRLQQSLHQISNRLQSIETKISSSDVSLVNISAI